MSIPGGNPERTDLLNRAQKGWLTIVLRSTEKVMALVRRLTSSQESGRLYEVINDITREEARQLRALAQQVDQTVAALDERFAFQPERQRVSQLLRAELSLLWTALEDSRLPKLGRFGEIDPRLHDALEAELERLIQLVLMMESIADRAANRSVS